MTGASGKTAYEQFALSGAPPVRALAITAVAALIGALLAVGAAALDLPLFVLVIGVVFLVIAGLLAVLALLAVARLRTTLILDADAVTVVRGSTRTSLTWSSIERVTLRGPRLTFIPRAGTPLSVVNPRAAAHPTFLALVAAVRQRLDANRGYRTQI